MYEIQDVILESEYNVLIKLSEYYEKQLILESFIMEANENSTNDSNSNKNENLIVRFINWCKQALARIKKKFKKIPPATPVPPPYSTAVQQTRNAVNMYNRAVSIENTNPAGSEQLMHQAQQTANQPIDPNAVNNNNTQTNSNGTVAELQQMSNEMEQAVNEEEAKYKNLQQQPGRLNNPDDPEVRKLNTKIKTGSTIIKKITDLISKIGDSIQDGLNINPTQQIEGEPSIDVDRYTKIVKVKFSKAKDANAAKKVYDDSETELRKAINWYTDKQLDPSTLPRDKTYCLKRIDELKNLNNVIKRQYREKMIDLSEGIKEPEPVQQQPEPVQNNQQVQPQQPTTQPQQPVQNVQPVQQPEPVQTNQPVTQQQPVQNVQPVAQPEPIQQPQPVVQPEPVQQPQPAAQTQQPVAQTQQPVQQPEPVQNVQSGGTMSGQEMFNLVKSLRSSNPQYRVYNSTVGRIEYSSDPNATFIIDNKNNVYPNAVDMFKTIGISPNVFKCSSNRGDSNSTITPAQIDSNGNVIQQGSIK